MIRLKILFWKAVAYFIDLRPRVKSDYPWAYTDIAESYEYPENVEVLCEWDEKGKHWIIFKR